MPRTLLLLLVLSQGWWVPPLDMKFQYQLGLPIQNYQYVGGVKVSPWGCSSVGNILNLSW